MKTLKFQDKATLSKIKSRIKTQDDFSKSSFTNLINKMEAVLKDELFKEYVTMFSEYRRLKRDLEEQIKEVRKGMNQIERGGGF